MKTLNIMLSNLSGRVIPIGYEGENLYTRIRINCIEVFSEYPDATVSMVVSPPVGDMYPAVVEKSGVMVVWDITDSVLSSNGSGECQLTFTEGDVVRKSVVFGISINRSLIASGEAPEPVQEWIDKAEQTAQEIAENAAMLAKQDIVESYGEIAPAIIETASGAIASFSDGADGMLVKTLEVQIDPVQDLHGYDSPWPAGGGKNLVDININTSVYSGSITFDNPIGETVTISAKKNSVVLSEAVWIIDVLMQDNTHYYIGDTGYSSPFPQTINATAQNPITKITWRNYGITSGSYDIQMEKGSTATAWTPYSNVCPISGWDSAEVTKTGKNLYSYDNFYAGYWLSSSFNGTGQSADYDTFNGWGFVKIPVEEGDTITISGCQQMGGTYSAFYHDDPKNIVSVFLNTSQNGTKTVPAGANYLGLCLQHNSIYDPKTEYPNAQVEIASSASTFEPYNASKIEYEFPQEAGTVYGGNLTIHQDGTGELVVDHKVKTLIGNENWLLENSDSFYTDIVEDAKKQHLVRCSVFKSYNASYVSGIENIWISSSGKINLTFPEISHDANALNTFLANLNTAGTPVQIVYELATPVTYELTNQQVLSLLKGNNVCFADCGNVALEYPADTKLYIDGKVAELQALILENISNS